MSQTSTDSSDEESESDSAPEVWSEDSFSDADDEFDPGKVSSTPIVQVQYILCLAISLLQLFYSISDRAVAYLLGMLFSVFQFMSSMSKQNFLGAFLNTFPRTVYSLRAKLQLKNSMSFVLTVTNYIKQVTPLIALII